MAEVRYILLSGKNGRGRSAIVDPSDFDRLSAHAWYLNPDGYAVRREGDSTIRMHREVLSVPDGVEVDHINQRPLDNRRRNLRPATRSQNLENRKPWSRHGLKGVIVHREGHVQACIKLRGRTIYVGTFRGEDALRRAALARDAYARKYQPRSRLNFPDRQVSLSEVETMRVPGYHQEPAYVRIDAWLAEQ